MLQARFFILLLIFLCPLAAQEPPTALPVIDIKAGAATIHAEVARTTSEKARGLMNRTQLPDNSGMLFILDGKSPATFWMKNTPLPLSIAFIDARGVILEITDLRPFDERTVRSASDTVAFALEMNQNWFSLNRVKAGTPLVLTGTTWAALLKGK